MKRHAHPRFSQLAAGLLVLSTLSTLAAGQHERAPEIQTKQRLTGWVTCPDGSPVSGAVVVTSAGGEDVSAADGSFELEILVPPGAESVDVTAVADAGAEDGRPSSSAANLVGTVRIVPSALASTVSVGGIVLGPASSCQERWLPAFGALPGVDFNVNALAVFDDGSGRALYAGGAFLSAGGVAASRIARWTGARWLPLGSGTNGSIEALAVFDDGSGPALYAGGSFTSAGGVSASRIARWDGSSWSALGSGIDGERVDALAVFDDGGGPALYVGGDFAHAGGIAVNEIARWDGSSWSDVGGGVTANANFPDFVRTLLVFDDGGGHALYAGGRFSRAGGVPALKIARWDGSTWSPLGSGIEGIAATVEALAVFDDGGGPELYAGGDFSLAGGAVNVARWNGSKWTGLDGGTQRPVESLLAFDDGSGPALYAGGDFFSASGVPATGIARWNGSSWSALGEGLGSNDVYALAVFDAGSGDELYVGGRFVEADGEEVNRIARWDGSSWSALGRGVTAAVFALTVFDDGSGPALYAGGGFRSADNVSLNRIARRDGSIWSALGSGITMGNAVRALAVFDDGGGAALYAGGDFSSADGMAASRIARWDGSSWSPLGSGISGVVNALVVFDDGSGPALYAGGDFANAGGAAANEIARWNGSSWSALGDGINANAVFALAVFDDGGGPALYAGGSFTAAGGVAASRIAKWDGSSWSALGSGVTASSFFPDVKALAVFDDGSGPALYAGGRFEMAGGVPAVNIARWDGSTWSALGSGVGDASDSVEALTVYEDGAGAQLYVGGTFSTAGGVAALDIARWDGSLWGTAGSGMNGRVETFTIFDDGFGPALLAGGSFESAASGDSHLAKWGCGRKFRLAGGAPR